VTGPSTPGTAAPESNLPELPGPEVQRELDDALYYLGAHCEPCAERHFEKARLLGASENTIAAARAKHAAADRTVPDRRIPL
jgi:hypothetical protein